MRLLFYTILFSFLCNYGIGQKRNISLSDLSKLVTIESISDAEKIITKYKYTLSYFKKDTLDGKESQIYLFEKRSNRFQYHLTCSRVLNSTKGFIVSLTSHDKKIADRFKSEVEADKNNSFTGEELADNCFRRKYKGQYDFLFSTCTHDNDPLPTHMVTIAYSSTFIRQ